MTDRAVRIFCSYSHKDKIFKEDLFRVLRPLEEQGAIKFWHDGAMFTGEELNGSIERQLKEADVVLLLISPDFLASEYCTRIELRTAMEHRVERGAVVVPIICRPTDWISYRKLGTLRAVPRDGKPISRWSDRDQAFLDVVQEIRRTVSELQGSTQPIASAEVEKELKFAGAANLQFKFVSVKSAEEIIERLQAICGILEIELSLKKTKRVSDEYYDDKKGSLYQQGLSLRRRVEDGRHLVTLKRAQQMASGFGVQRLEHEFTCKDDEFRKLITDREHFRSVFREILENTGDIPPANLFKILTIHNSRTSIKLSTGLAKYTFCYDKFYFYDQRTGQRSEYFTEIEIEASDAPPEEDHKLNKLVESVETIFQHSSHVLTKLQQGLAWLRSQAAAKEYVHVAALEIVNFAGLRPEDQKQALQALNHHAKEAIREVRRESVDTMPVCISSGGEMVIVFENRPDTIVPIIARLQERVRKAAGDPPSIRFSFRTGIHAGTVFKFTDASENLSFGGDGIHLARQVMLLGSDWHVLSTVQSLSPMWENNRLSPETHIGRYPIGADEGVEVLNLHEHEKDFGRFGYGNPAEPMPYGIGDRS